MEVWAVVYNCCGCAHDNLHSLWPTEQAAGAALVQACREWYFGDSGDDVTADEVEEVRVRKHYQVVRYEVLAE